MAAPSVLMVGTGEYTSGLVGGSASTSDKTKGVVALSLFDLRRRGKVGKLSMVGVSGRKFPGIRQHFQQNISEVYNNLDVSFQSYPKDDQTDPEAYKQAINDLPKGSIVIIFTPDPTHHPIAMYAVERSHHVMITKPATQRLSEHLELLEASRKAGVYIFVEHHKRFDPAYADARHRAHNSLGDFNYFYSYMSQPKSQLETFKSWAGKESDISMYLNSHHVDICDSMVSAKGWRPTQVTASGSTGIAEGLGCQKGTEDTITLLVNWSKEDGKAAIGVYTASWGAPMKAGVHSNQYFHYMASGGEVRIDQAKRGYDVTVDGQGLTWYNPFYMKYAPDEEGNFAGQGGYGYVSFEKFIDGVAALKSGKVTLQDLDKRPLPTLANTVATTAILEAGRRSLDEKRPIQIVRDGDKWSLQ